MHELVVVSATLAENMFGWARTAIAVLLWFWVISGALFGLRFFAFMLIDRRHNASPLQVASSLIPFPGQSFEEQSRHERSPE